MSTAFQLVLVLVFSLTLICGLASVLVGLSAMPAEKAMPLIEMFTSTFKFGAGALIGLLGGKVT